jgi:hypothetical protein
LLKTRAAMRGAGKSGVTGGGKRPMMAAAGEGGEGRAGITEEETHMAKDHPIHALRSNLEKARLKAVESLAASGALSPGALNELMTLQVALTAVREEIAARGASLGSGAERELD